jgi:hypothetical protein
MAMAYLMGTGVAIAEKEEAEEAQPSVGVWGPATRHGVPRDDGWWASTYAKLGGKRKRRQFILVQAAICIILSCVQEGRRLEGPCEERHLLGHPGPHAMRCCRWYSLPRRNLG